MKFSDGAGTPSTIRSSSAWVPAFFVAAAAGDREELAARAPRACSASRISSARDLVALEVLRDQLVGDLDDGLDEPLAPDRGLAWQCSAGIGAGLGLARAVAGVLVGDHVEHVDHAAEVVLGAHRDGDRDAARRELLLERRERRVEVGALAVEQVDEHHARRPELVAAAPQPRGR